MTLPDAPLRKTRWLRLRFDLATLLILVVPLAIGADVMRRYLEHREAKRSVDWVPYSAAEFAKHQAAVRTVMVHFHEASAHIADREWAR